MQELVRRHKAMTAEQKFVEPGHQESGFRGFCVFSGFLDRKKGLPYQALLDSTQAASTLLLGILYPYPKHTHIAAKGMPTLCQGYAKGMPRVCEKLLFPIEPFCRLA